MTGTGSFWLAAATALFAIVGGGQVALGSRRVRYLREVVPAPVAELPSLSIVVAARNEERGIAAGLTTLLRLEGVRFELIVVDDRSEDATRSIVKSIADHAPRLRLVEIHRLPPGWLGKNHALQSGVARGVGEWILFTDADVLLAPDSVARALSFAIASRLDHVAVTPEMRMPTWTTDLFAGAFVMLFSRYAMPWKARDPRSRAHIGIGAFNLVRREAYDRIGGHARISLRPDDDMALGKLLKTAGYRQDALFGTGLVRVEWYASIREAIDGLEKNAFAGLRYSVSAVVATCASLLVFGVWPWIATLATTGVTRWLNLLVVLGTVALYVQSTRSSGANPRLAPALPLGLLLFCYIIARAAALAMIRGHIRWRGTTYDLEELRANRI